MVQKDKHTRQMKYIIISFIYITFLSQTAFAKISLPFIFANGMVLQQQSDVKIWGKSNKKQVVVTTSWDKKSVTANVGENGKWEVKVATPKAGGPYEIILNDGDQLKLSDVLIGEVWLVSGQSNMEMPIQGFKGQPVLNSAEILQNAKNPKIKLFRVIKEAKGAPVDNFKGKWQKIDTTSVKLFSAIGYLFGVKLQEKLNVPVGIIQSAWGGTGIESWMSGESLAEFKTYPVKDPSTVTFRDRNSPSALFNGMISPMIGYGMKGVLWYQGERNHREPELYAKMFPKMVSDWRTRWGIGNWPFYYAEIAPIETIKDGADISLLALFREMQFNSQTTIPNAAMSVTLDAGEQKLVHPANKQIVADRLLAIALNKTYGFKAVNFSGPVYKSNSVNGNQLTLSFDFAKNGLKPLPENTPNFEVAGKDKVFYPAVAKVVDNTVVLTSAKVKQPVAARYGFKMWVKGDLYNAEGLPATSFRTDNWFAGPYGKN